jgi:hypothetical protein
MPSRSRLVCFIATADADRARVFYSLSQPPRN